LSDSLVGFNNLVVVEPRSQLCIGLQKYVADMYNIDTAYWTNGVRSSVARVTYITPTELMLHLSDFVNSNSVFIFDEVHVSEGAYYTCFEVIKGKSLPMIGLTGTPSEYNIDSFDVHKPLALSKLWTITENVMTSNVSEVKDLRREYENFVMSQVSIMHPASKALIFYPWAKRSKFGDRFPYNTSYLHSQSTDTSGQIILTTSVADVGITVPNVDLVITPDFDFMQVAEGSVLAVKLVRLSPMTLLQRKGRTGRTNNGAFVKFTTPHVNFTHSMTADVLKQTAFLECLQMGISGEILSSIHSSEAKKLALEITGKESLEDNHIVDVINHIREYIDDVRVLRMVRDSITNHDMDYVEDWVHLDAIKGGDFAVTAGVPTQSVLAEAFGFAKEYAKEMFEMSADSSADLSIAVQTGLANIKRAIFYNQIEDLFQDVTVRVA